MLSFPRLLLLPVLLAGGLSLAPRAGRGQTLPVAPPTEALQRQVAAHPAGPARAVLLTRLAEEMARANTRAALAIARQAVAEAPGEPATEAAALGQVGLLYLPLGRYDSAERYLRRQQTLAADLPRHPTARALAALNQATLLAARADMAAALAGYTEALRLADSAADWHLTTRALLGASAATTNMAIDERAEVYLRDATRAAGQARDSACLALIWRERGFLRMRARDSAGTSGWIVRTLALQHRLHDWSGLGRTYSLYGNLLNVTGHFALAEAAYQQAATLLTRVGDPIRLAYTEVNRGINFRGWKQYPQALTAYQHTMAICQALGDRRGRREALVGLASTYAAMGQFEPAYQLQKQYTALRDSILNDNFTRQVADADVRYQAGASAQQARIKALEVTEQRLVVRRRTALVVALATALLAGLVAGAGWWSRTRWRQRLALQAERTAQERAGAEAVIEAEERERQRIGADLHDGVGQLLAAAKLNFSALQHELHLQEPSQQARFEASLDVLDESLREVRTLSHQLVPNALLRQGLVAAIREFVNRIGAAGSLRTEVDTAGLDQRLPPAVESIVYRAVQEVVANVVRHAHADQLTLQLISRPDELTVLIEDNGIGFSMAEVQERVTGGIGLRNLHSRINYLGGRLEIDSRPGRGTIVSFDIPLAAFSGVGAAHPQTAAAPAAAPTGRLLVRTLAAMLLPVLLLLAGAPARAQAPVPTAAQKRQVDSLRMVLRQKTLPDTTRAVTLFNLGLLLRYLQPDSAQRQILLSAAVAERIGATRQYANAQNLLGALAKDRGDFKRALKYQLAALLIHDRLGNQAGQCITHNDLGIIYKQIRQFAQAREHYEASARIAEALAQNPGPNQTRFASAVAYTLNNIGTIHFEEKNYAQALPFYERALAQARRVKNPDAEATVLTNLGEVSSMMGRPQEALRYTRQALRIDQQIGAQEGVLADLIVLAEQLTKVRQFRSAEDTLRQALRLAQTLKSGEMVREALRRFPLLYHAMGDAARTFAAHERYLSISDSLFNSESATQLAELRTRYETDKHAQENQVQALQLSQQRLVIRKREVQLLALLGGVLGAAFITWLLFNRVALRQRLALAREREEQQRARAVAVLEAEEHERRRIGADLHDGVGQLLSATKLNLSGLQHEAPELPAAPRALLDTALDTLDESLREVRALSHQLVPNALLRQGLVAAVRELVNKFRHPGGLRVELDVLGLDERLPTNVETAVYRAIQELVANVVRHSHADTVTIQLVGRPDALAVLIEDNGVGFDVAQALQKAESGIGLRNLFSRIEYLGGTLELDSRPGRGTIASIEVPLEK